MRGSVTPIFWARSRFSSLSRISRHCIWPPMQRSATAASTPSGAPPGPIYMSTPVLSGSEQGITPGTSPSVIRRTAAPGSDVGGAEPDKYQNRGPGRINPLRLRQPLDIVGGRGIELDHALVVA